MYRCDDCGCEFYESKIKIELYPYTGVCPNCHSRSYEKLFECIDCGELVVEDELSEDGICQKCNDELVA